ncbi:LytTR family transcriptional regulator [Butyrivibrio sp. X503]|uniref:LytTR family DNA-binding domain-containing protein n=1 Tax=Butyrivibrio sp. X503 TaxID=2364878 RepID=UPI000EAA6A2E|nr:LytTR family DNA-binding domain-containing protein [Butyrivibrio sp. X503]RKM55848.1 LytTR family transcriptional regulator [Butyrivibrio sp. X503]
MKVNVIISPEVHEAYAEIHTDKMTEDISRIVDMLSTEAVPVTARAGEELVVLKPEDIFMVRVENGDTVIYGEKRSFRSPKRLYELASQLGNKFMQISKSTLINLSYMDSIEPGFSGTLLLKLKNGSKDYVSRKYLPEFKKYLGL